jgi:hypothetical protein
MPLLKPEVFDRYTWWHFKETDAVFIVADTHPIYADDKKVGYEIGLVQLSKNKIQWRNEADLIKLKAKGVLKEL